MVERIYRDLSQSGLITVPFFQFKQAFENDTNYRKTILKDFPQYAFLEEPKYKQESQEEKFLVDNIPFIGDFIGDIGRAWKSGLRASESVDESIEVMKGLFGEGASDEDILKFISAYNSSSQAPSSDEMMSFNEIYEKEGKGVWGFLKGVADSPTIIPQLFVSSMATMIGSAVDSDDVRGLAAGGAALGSFGGPTGIFAGGVGALATGMEAALTFGELLKEEVGEDNFTLENIRAVLDDPDKADSLLQKAVARGIAIGAFEALAGSVAGKAVRGISLRTGSKTAASAAGVGVEHAARGATGAIPRNCHVDQRGAAS